MKMKTVSKWYIRKWMKRVAAAVRFYASPPDYEIVYLYSYEIE